VAAPPMQPKAFRLGVGPPCAAECESAGANACGVSIEKGPLGGFRAPFTTTRGPRRGAASIKADVGALSDQATNPVTPPVLELFKASGLG